MDWQTLVQFAVRGFNTLNMSMTTESFDSCDTRALKLSNKMTDGPKMCYRSSTK
jgi:hypothetical protein